MSEYTKRITCTGGPADKKRFDVPVGAKTFTTLGGAKYQINDTKAVFVAEKGDDKPTTTPKPTK